MAQEELNGILLARRGRAVEEAEACRVAQVWFALRWSL